MCSSERRPAWRSKPPSLAKQLDADRKFMSVGEKAAERGWLGRRGTFELIQGSEVRLRI